MLYEFGVVWKGENNCGFSTHIAKKNNVCVHIYILYETNYLDICQNTITIQNEGW